MDGNGRQQTGSAPRPEDALLTVEAYRHQVLRLAEGWAPRVEWVELSAASGRVLGQDLIARYAVPPFDNSAMDGFAVVSADVVGAPVELPVVGESAAAAGPLPRVLPGTAARVMTGARIPPGADAVVPVEDTDQSAGAVPLPARVRILQAVAPGRHIRRAADDLAAGASVLPAGTLLTPAALGAAASIGYGNVAVRCRPRVAVVATGAELVAPGRPLDEGQIPDSNSGMLAALATAAGAEVVAVERSGDDPAELARVLRDLPRVDVAFTAGGVSAGAYEPLRQLTASLSFHVVAMQPGKPQGCGLVGGVPVVSFPGNPVSAFVSFHVFGRPLLDALSGVRRPAVRRFAPALDAWRSPAGRRQYVPVTTGADGIRLSHRLGSGSHLVASLHLADALAIVPEAKESVSIGDLLEVMAV